jgi:type VI secretion system protein ImpL
MAAAQNHGAWMRQLLGVLGVLAAAALVWFVGPLVTVAQHAPLASEQARWVAIALVAAGIAADAAWRMVRSAQRNRRLMEGLVTGGAVGTAGAPEVALLGQRFEEAVSLLRRSRIGGRNPFAAALSGRPYVYQLPWYVIIGAPGAGKTTALVNSGLEFPLATKVGGKVLRGIGGTRNCDWWFSTEAVLVDTAGRYTTHDSHREADRAAWLGFLDLLVRYRPRRPVNGVLLTLSVSDLLGAAPEARLAHAAELRARIDELQRHLGIRFPIYVLVTKTDLLAGFMEFFADLDKDERAQVWGVTFPYEGEGAATDPMLLAASEFAALEKRLHECMLERLHAETDRERRGAIYAFPQQWRLLRETLHEFMQAVFAGSPTGGAQPLVRGVYFTSATQEGTPVDRALGGLARKLGLAHRVVAPARPSGKTFFVTRLLRDVVFAESGLAGTNLRWERRRAALQWGLVGAAVCAVAGTAVLAWQAYGNSRDQVATLAERLPALERQVLVAKTSAPTDLAALLPTLDAFETLAGSAHIGSAFDLGLDAGERLDAAAQDSYRRLLKEAFLPRIAARLEQRLRSGGQDHVELIYEALRAYLMLFSGKNFDRAALRAYLGAEWDGTLPATVTPEQRNALRRHLERLLAGGEVGAPTQADAKLIADARGLVAGVPLPVRAYSRLKQIDFGPEAAPFSAETAAGPTARRVFARASGRPLAQGVPALYSRAVHQRALRPRTLEVLRQFGLEAPWVLGGAGTGVLDSQALVDEVERLYLADYERQWDGYIADLRLAAPATLSAGAELAQTLARPDSPLAALLRAIVREASIGPLAARLDGLRGFVDGLALGEMQALLAALGTHMSAVDDAVKRKTVPPSGDVMRPLTGAAQRAPEPVRAMLLPLASTSAAQVLAALREPLSRQLAGELAPACARVVGARYPFVRASREEVSRDEFEKAFAAGGLIDGFFQRHLAPYADALGRSESLLPFQRAQAIRDAFFTDGGRRLGMRLELRLLELDPGVSEFVLDVDGQALRFKRDVKAPQTLQWPGNGSGRVQLQLAGGSPYVFEGPWALLRMLDRVRVEPAGPGRFQLVFDVEGRKARFEARSATPLNAAQREDLEQFQCPKRL